MSSPDKNAAGTKPARKRATARKPATGPTRTARPKRQSSPGEAGETGKPKTTRASRGVQPKGGASPVARPGAETTGLRSGRSANEARADDFAPDARSTKPRVVDAPDRISPEQRRVMIEEAAYYRAARRGFVGGNPELDWKLAEIEIDAEILRRSELHER